MPDISRLPEIKADLKTLISKCNNTAFVEFDNAFYFDQQITEELKEILNTTSKLLKHLQEK